jgi:hypothetical protein
LNRRYPSVHETSSDFGKSLFQRFRKSRKRFFLLSKGCWDIPLVGIPLYPHVFVYLNAVAGSDKVPLTKNKGFVCWLFLFFASAKQRK